MRSWITISDHQVLNEITIPCFYEIPSLKHKISWETCHLGLVCLVTITVSFPYFLYLYRSLSFSEVSGTGEEHLQVLPLRAFLKRGHSS